MKKITIKNYEPTTGLEKSTKKLLLQNIGSNNVKRFFKDLLKTGCTSGMVRGFIYYSETLPFYKKHKKEINLLLAKTLQGCSMPDFFGSDFDYNDPLCLEPNNQDVLAWFGFEMTVIKIASDIGLDV